MRSCLRPPAAATSECPHADSDETRLGTMEAKRRSGHPDRLFGEFTSESRCRSTPRSASRSWPSPGSVTSSRFEWVSRDEPVQFALPLAASDIERYVPMASVQRALERLRPCFSETVVSKAALPNSASSRP